MNEINLGLEIAPCIYVYDNFINNCEQIIDRALSRDTSEWTNARVLGDGGGEINTNVRNTTTINIDPIYRNDIHWFSLAQKLWKNGNDYAIKHDISFANMEFPQFLMYEKEVGRYTPHIDNGPGVRSRIFSSVLYLNDVEVGGETYFNRFDISVEPKAGRLITFPAEFSYQHEAKTPMSSKKYVIVTWFNPQ